VELNHPLHSFSCLRASLNTVRILALPHWYYVKARCLGRRICHSNLVTHFNRRSDIVFHDIFIFFAVCNEVHEISLIAMSYVKYREEKLRDMCVVAWTEITAISL